MRRQQVDVESNLAAAVSVRHARRRAVVAGVHRPVEAAIEGHLDAHMSRLACCRHLWHKLCVDQLT